MYILLISAGQSSLTGSGGGSTTPSPSVGGSGGGDLPPPAPPRSSSVRLQQNRRSGSSLGSRDTSPSATPQVRLHTHANTHTCDIMETHTHVYSRT